LSNQIIKDLEKLASNLAFDKGLEIVALKLNPNIKPMIVQVQIRQKNGLDVSLDDCALFSTPLGEAIEFSEVLNSPYVLEISSPGLSEVIETDREFETFKGFPIEVVLRNEENSSLLKSGLLHERTKEHLLINIKGRLSKIPRQDVIKVRLTSPTS